MALAPTLVIVWAIVLAAACGEGRADPASDLYRSHAVGDAGSVARPLTIDSARSRIVIDLVPEQLGAAGTDTAMRIAAPRAVALPIEGWLQSVNVKVLDAAGRPLPRTLLHHVNVIAPEQRELFSPIMSRIGAAGPETAPIQLPRLLGLRVHRGDSLLVTAMLDNPGSEPQRDVTIRVELGYVAVGSWLPPISIRPFYMDVMPPAGSHSYDLPPGRSEKSWQGSPAIDGRVLAVGGHLHQYGVALRFRDITSARNIWEARPVRDSAGDVLAVPTAKFLWRGGVTLRPDHVYRLTAEYDNPTGHIIPDGAMGTLGGVFLPARGAKWPAVARNDPAYRLDVQVTYDTTISMKMAMDSHPSTRP